MKNDFNIYKEEYQCRNNSPGITVLDGDTNDVEVGDEPDDDLAGGVVCCCDVIVGNPWGGE